MKYKFNKKNHELIIYEITFLRIPVDVPKKIIVFLSVVAKVTEVIRCSGKFIAACVLIGTSPDIFKPTSQKFNIFPVDCNIKEKQF